ncbi:MAG: 2-amino-4-hydroxy-6-hydroxymethyldihydropteridine diphosphokinase [Bacteroidales bacterium]|nr:2-amino-4-hydroxy-6-hydroxymethyldihydropteridine diphosphokinase [Bacteroidales bacterium]
MWDGRRETRHQQKNKVGLYLGLGSNQGDRAQNIEHAVSMLNVELKTPYKAISSLLETEPWGFESQEKFMNAVVLYELELPEGYNPEAEGLMILEICKDIERKMGRTGEPQYDEKGERIYTDRPIDIDILLFGDNKIDCPELTVPHKLMYERDFVMIPLREINDKL